MKVLEISARRFGMAFLLLVGLAAISFAQQPRQTPTPTLVIDSAKADIPVATKNNLYCAGYIQNSPVNTSFEIVGSDKEREQNIFAQGQFVYVNRGENAGAKVGDMFAVVRPRGKFKSDFSKKGRLGIYVEELGTIEIVKVKADVSVARIKNSCNNFVLGDLLQPIEARTSPVFQDRPALDQFGESSGKSSGHIVLARDAREAPTRDQIVYIDLGAEDNVQIGQYLTIFRPLGKGGVRNYHQEDTYQADNDGFESKTYKGGKFSNNAPRRAGENADKHVVTAIDAKKGRPKNLRQIVGEMVILNVKERTATALITRTAGEIHTGDDVEVQ